jgi:hypothetical protein
LHLQFMVLSNQIYTSSDMYLLWAVTSSVRHMQLWLIAQAVGAEQIASSRIRRCFLHSDLPLQCLFAILSPPIGCVLRHFSVQPYSRRFHKGQYPHIRSFGNQRLDQVQTRRLVETETGITKVKKVNGGECRERRKRINSRAF